MKESQIQNKIIKHYEALGYYVIKLIKTNKSGIADLIAVKKNEIIFIEVKAEKGRLSELQKFRKKELEEKGITVLVLKGVNDPF